MKMPAQEISAWLGLYLIPGLGNAAFRNLLSEFGSAEAVFRAKTPELLRVRGISEPIGRSIVNKQFSTDPEAEIKRAEKNCVRIISFADPSYPSLLKEIHSPPMVLYVKGKTMPSNRMRIAVVGSRHPTHYGLKAAETIGFGLAEQRIGVVSGMAKGIDSAAHHGCLQCKGFTVAVIGTGIDVVYPSSNRALFERICEQGTVLSEFPMGSPPEPKNFPIRNRIISGLSRGVVVVEATKKSGSLITASMALDQGREVFAVPGSISSFKSTGTHLLIKQGAKLVENVDDILDEFELGGSPAETKCLFDEVDDRKAELNGAERRLFEMLGDYPLHIDEIAKQVKMDAAEISSTLMQLELKGLVRQLIGKRFVR